MELKLLDFCHIIRSNSDRGVEKQLHRSLSANWSKWTISTSRGDRHWYNTYFDSMTH